MIRNEKEYKITKAAAEKFADGLFSMKKKEGVSEPLFDIERRAMQSELDILNLQIKEYEERRELEIQMQRDAKIGDDATLDEEHDGITGKIISWDKHRVCLSVSHHSGPHFTLAYKTIFVAWRHVKSISEWKDE